MGFAPMHKFEIDKKISKLPTFMQEKILICKSLLKQQQRIEGLELLEKAFQDNKLVFDYNKIKYSKQGKPFVVNSIEFSISYSNNNVGLGLIFKKFIGVDSASLSLVWNFSQRIVRKR